MFLSVIEGEQMQIVTLRVEQISERNRIEAARNNGDGSGHNLKCERIGAFVVFIIEANEFAATIIVGLRRREAISTATNGSSLSKSLRVGAGGHPVEPG